MEQRELIIHTARNPEIAGAIIDGIAKQVINLNGQELGALRAELARLRTHQDGRKYRRNRDWQITRMELEKKYGTKPHSAIYKGFWVCYAMIWLALDACWKKLLHLFGMIWR